jgi:hypothetical protein
LHPWLERRRGWERLTTTSLLKALWENKSIEETRHSIHIWLFLPILQC